MSCNVKESEQTRMCFLWVTTFPPSMFCGSPLFSFCVIMLTNKRTRIKSATSLGRGNKHYAMTTQTHTHTHDQNKYQPVVASDNY